MSGAGERPQASWQSGTDLGCHRVIEPAGVLPQPAWRLDNTPTAGPGETLVQVHLLHLDAASFAHIAGVCDRDEERIKAYLTEIVRQRGKMHNPVTGSGGVLLGRLVRVDEVFARTYQVQVGDPVVSLTSLSWLPLSLQRIHAVQLARGEVEVEGQAIFFRCTPLTRLPEDLPSSVAVAALDVAGAPARALSLARPGQRVTVLGAGGKAGLLTLCALRERLGARSELIAIENDAAALQDIDQLGYADVLLQGDATRPLEVLDQVRAACQGRPYAADLTINVVNVPQTETASILLTRDQGRILFFSMATSFTVAALSAEGLGRPVEMHIGNGYMPDLGQVALQMLRTHPALLAVFARRFGGRL